MPPPAGRLIQATPGWSGALAPGTPVTVHISVTVPSDFRQCAIAGTLQIRDGRAMLPRPLPVRIQVAPAAVTAAVNGRSGRSDR